MIAQAVPAVWDRKEWNQARADAIRPPMYRLDSGKSNSNVDRAGQFFVIQTPQCLSETIS